MFQNHLLQILTLVAMEPRPASPPTHFATRRSRSSTPFRSTPAEQAAQHVVTGQYAGYLQAKGVAKGSKTPTYAAVELSIDNWRWRGVPFFCAPARPWPGARAR